VLAVVATQSAQAQTFSVLYSFKGSPDGAFPYAHVVIDKSGNLYGTTTEGGTSGLGTAFKLDAAGTETVLHSFTGNPDGTYPEAGFVMDQAGNLYSTTYRGGSGECSYGCGTVFKLGPSGKETILYRFTGGADGGGPIGGVIRDSNGNLYGTTSEEGAYGNGTVFKLDTTGTLTVLHTFNADTGDGGGSHAGLAIDSEGNLYGTTWYGCRYGWVFKVDTTGQEAILHCFSGAGWDGTRSGATLIFDGSGHLYGTTQYGGPHRHGNVFKLNEGGRFTLLYGFTGASGDGAWPFQGVIGNAAGGLFGTTAGGGTFGDGTVFEVTKDGKEIVLHNFTGGSDGASPLGSLVPDAAGNIYGTASDGGTSNDGTVWKLTP